MNSEDEDVSNDDEQPESEEEETKASFQFTVETVYLTPYRTPKVLPFMREACVNTWVELQ